MKSWIVALLCLVLWEGSLLAGGSKPAIVLRFHIQVSEHEQVDNNSVIRVFVPDPDEAVLIHKFASLSEKNVAQATALADGGTLIQFDSTGSTILDTDTTTNIGKILVVICNGRVIYAPIIDQPMRQGRMVLPGILPEEVKALQAYIVKRRKT